MQLRWRLAVLSAALAAMTAGVAWSSPASRVREFEWLDGPRVGTFLSVQGSDGVTLAAWWRPRRRCRVVEQRSIKTWERSQWYYKMGNARHLLLHRQAANGASPGGHAARPADALVPDGEGFGPAPEKPGAPKPTGGSFLEWEKRHLIPTTPKLVLQDHQPVPALWRVKATTRGSSPGDRLGPGPSARPRTRADATFDTRSSCSTRPRQFRDALEVRSDGADREARLTLTNRGPQPIRSLSP